MAADRPRPAPPRNAEPRQQIAPEQYIRLQAARISAEYHVSRSTVSDAQILALASRIERFISTGKTGD